MNFPRLKRHIEPIPSVPSTPSSDWEKSTMAERYSDAQLKQEANESGHIQELERNFSLLSICSVGIVTGSSWAALGGSIVVAISNGGPAGVIYEFVMVNVFYWMIAASLAELASAMPSSAGIYHWASLTPGPKYGRICGWFAGWWNTFAWILAAATMSSITSNIAYAMYGIYHPDFAPSILESRWQIFIGYVVLTWLACCIVLFANKALPQINNIGLFFIIGGVLITILVCAIMPHTSGSGYATSSSVWAEWENSTGWDSNGFVFLAGMLNGAFAVGVPDCVSHLAEEIPNPSRNVPLAIGAQMVTGFVTSIGFLVAILYAITNLPAISAAATNFPLAIIYAQATSSKPATIGLLFLILVPIFCTLIGTYITAGRCLWTLARDSAVPFSAWNSRISPRFKNPFNATLTCGGFVTILGVISIGSTTAFNALISSFIVLSTLSYLTAILPFIFTGRFSHAGEEPGFRQHHNGMMPGDYHMGHKLGMGVNIVSCVYIVVFIVIFCFPATLPVTSSNMNYSIVIVAGVSVFAAAWWAYCGKTYVGPKALLLEDSIRMHELEPTIIEREVKTQ